MMTDKRYYSEKKISSSKNMRIFQNAMGISMVIIGGLGFFAYIGSPSDFTVVDLLLYVAIVIGGIVLYVFGKKRKNLIENCLQYVQYMDVQETIEISELSIKMGKSQDCIVKELGMLTEKQYFTNIIIDYSTNQIKMLAKREEEEINTRCETVIRDKNFSDLERERIQQEAEDNDVIRIYERVNGNEKLKVYKDRIEVFFVRNKQEVTVAYHYYNVKSICADKFMKGDRIAIKMADDNELSFFLYNASMEEYEELATLLSELKANAVTIKELGISEEEALRELKDNKEKSRFELTKKIGKFISEYKNFKELELMNKILHIVVPVLLLILVSNIFSGNDKRIIETDAVTSGAVYNLNLEESKEIVENAIKECWGVKISLDEDFELKEDETSGGINYIYYVNDESVFGCPLGVEIFVIDGYVQAFAFKTDTSSMNLEGLGIIQELYCEVANEVTDDNISLEDVKEIVKNNENGTDLYRNDSMHLICRNQDTFVFYYMFYACSEEYYVEGSN